MKKSTSLHNIPEREKGGGRGGGCENERSLKMERVSSVSGDDVCH